MITLAEVKNYLRVDYSEDDKLISDLLITAKQLCMEVGRMDEEKFERNEDITRTAMLFTVSYLYENRNTADFHKLALSLRSLLFKQREGII
ncbi:MAG: head-tail connector protein [Ruminococcus sp.]|nr:head-tail connector protein [Ruminococcus sp.]